MITIKISNAREVVLAKKGWFVANIAGAIVDLEAEVEAVVMERLRATLAAEGVEATVERVPT